jgi:hypothetical protein
VRPRCEQSAQLESFLNSLPQRSAASDFFSSLLDGCAIYGKNSSNAGFDQHYNAQVAVDQSSLLIVATSLSNHPTDRQEVAPTLAVVAPALGPPDAAALDNGYWSPTNLKALQDRSIEAYIATGREPHHHSGSP